MKCSSGGRPGLWQPTVWAQGIMEHYCGSIVFLDILLSHFLYPRGSNGFILFKPFTIAGFSVGLIAEERVLPKTERCKWGLQGPSMSDKLNAHLNMIVTAWPRGRTPGENREAVEAFSHRVIVTFETIYNWINRSVQSLKRGTACGVCFKYNHLVRGYGRNSG